MRTSKPIESPTDPSNPSATPRENARFAAFMETLERDGFSPITRACYASDWWTVSEHWLRATRRKFRLGGFPPEAFAVQRAQLASHGSSPATLNRRLSFLRRYSAFAAEREPVLRDVAAGFAALPFQPVPKRTTRALTHPQEQSLRAAADSQGPQSAALVALLLGTGLRASEVAELTRADVVGPRSAPRAVRVRGERAKTVLLGPIAKPRIAALLAGGSKGESTPLFTGKTGTALGEDGVAGIVERVARAAGVEASPRTLRHTFAVRYLSEHRDDFGGLASALGHEGLDSVRAYREEAGATGPVIRVQRWSDFDELVPDPGVRRRRFGGSRVVLERDLLAPRTRVLARSFPTERVTLVLSGAVLFHVGSGEIEAGAGDLVSVPSETSYAISVSGDRPAMLLHVAAPARGMS